MKQLNFLKKKPSSDTDSVQIFVDGAARNNPGPAGAGVYITQGKKILVKRGFYLGSKTNNQAEYLALALAIFLAKQVLAKQEIVKNKIPETKLLIASDSELLVKQMNGQYKVKNPELKKIKTLASSLLRDTTYSIRHVMREKNTIADALANIGIDKKLPIPADFLTLLVDHDLEI